MLVEGIEMDVEEALRGGQALTKPAKITASVESLLPEDWTSGRNCTMVRSNDCESTINHIKMGSIPSKTATSSSRESQGQNPQSSNENFMVQVMRQQEAEIERCNTLINRLRSESADLELTIVGQRQEI